MLLKIFKSENKKSNGFATFKGGKTFKSTDNKLIKEIERNSIIDKTKLDPSLK